jgi:DNA-binding transcriptional LysR family regulator
MEFRQLECFYMVSKLSNFTKAAEQLHVSQPAITKAIHCLETELNLRLFDRDQKRVTLTPQGQALLVQTERILSSVKDAVSEMSEFHNTHSGVIKLGVPPMIGAYMFPTIIANFRQQYPLIDFEVFEDGSLDIVSKVDTGELDLAIAILPESRLSLKTLPIMEEEFVLCVHPNSPLLRNKIVSFSQLRNEAFILLKPGNFQYQNVLKKCSAYHYSPNVILTSNHFKTIKGLVANGVGISFLMRMVVEEYPFVTTVPLAEPINCEIGLVWKEGKHLPQVCKTFIAFVKEFHGEKKRQLSKIPASSNY